MGIKKKVLQNKITLRSHLSSRPLVCRDRGASRPRLTSLIFSSRPQVFPVTVGRSECFAGAALQPKCCLATRLRAGSRVSPHASLTPIRVTITAPTYKLTFKLFKVRNHQWDTICQCIGKTSVLNDVWPVNDRCLANCVVQITCIRLAWNFSIKLVAVHQAQRAFGALYFSLFHVKQI